MMGYETNGLHPSWFRAPRSGENRRHVPGIGWVIETEGTRARDDGWEFIVAQYGYTVEDALVTGA